MIFHKVALALLFICLAIFYPQVKGKNWSSEMTDGYRIGITGVTILYIIDFIVGTCFNF